MTFEFDPKKSAHNLKKHGVGLEWATQLWEATHVVVPADFRDERRWLILAEVEGKCWAAVFTRRGRSIRLISCHRADERLEKAFIERAYGETEH